MLDSHSRGSENGKWSVRRREWEGTRAAGAWLGRGTGDACPLQRGAGPGHWAALRRGEGGVGAPRAVRCAGLPTTRARALNKPVDFLSE